MRKLLLLAANPENSTWCRLDEEVRDIQEGLNRARHRSEFQLIQRWAVRPRDFQRALLEEKPHIIHFLGHAVGDAGLYFENDVGDAQSVTEKALASSFQLFTQEFEIECVVLNGCFSQAQGEAIAQYVPYVIGLPKTASERAAIEFAVGFYDALGNGASIEFAFGAGKAAMEMASNEGHSSSPVLLQPPVSEKPQSSTMPPLTKQAIEKKKTEQSQTRKEAPGFLTPATLKSSNMKNWLNHNKKLVFISGGIVVLGLFFGVWKLLFPLGKNSFPQSLRSTDNNQIGGHGIIGDGNQLIINNGNEPGQSGASTKNINQETETLSESLDGSWIGDTEQVQISFEVSQNKIKNLQIIYKGNQVCESLSDEAIAIRNVPDSKFAYPLRDSKQFHLSVDAYYESLEIPNEKNKFELKGQFSGSSVKGTLDFFPSKLETGVPCLTQKLGIEWQAKQQ